MGCCLLSLLPAQAMAAAAQATAPAATDKSLPQRKPRVPRLLMIDPGHGGHDPGAIAANGVQEKSVTLDIALSMADALESASGGSLRAKLTRQSDIFLPLQDRLELAHDAKADLFLSIHADSAPNQAARGLSVYTLSEKASDKLAEGLAEKENRAGLSDGIDAMGVDREVAAILFDLTARRTRNTAQRAKSWFVRSMGRNWRLLENPARSANFAVLRSPNVPAMLVETGFLSNPDDELLLSQPKQRRKIAGLMAKEISSILKSDLFG